MHESHHDTWNYSKRKLRQLRGTPANKYVHFVAGGITLGWVLTCYFITNADFMEQSKERHLARTTETQFDKERELIAQNVLLGSAIRNLQARREAKENCNCTDKNKNNTYNINSNYNTTKRMESRLILRKNSNESQSKQLELLKNCSNEKENTKDNEIMADDNKNATTSKRNGCKRIASPDADDSLADFKLPKLITKPQLLNKKVKLVNNKSSSSTSRGGKKRQIKRRKSSEALEKNQPSIESSFFKPSTAFVCPLCLKSFNDFNIQSIHTKNCALKNNVPTKRLLAAVELQERQAEERLAIGLPAAPFQQAKRKAFNTKKMSTEGDPDIQLAIALSKSLNEMEEKEQFDEALVLAAETNEDILQMTLTQRKSTLQNFGFVTNKLIAETVNERPKRKKNIGTTILQTRTQETRERLLSNRIGEILIGTEAITQLQLAEEKCAEKKVPLSLRSGLLKQIHRPNSDLWNQSRSTKQHSAYYVEVLSEFISPTDESEAKLIHIEDNGGEIIAKQSPINDKIINKLNGVKDNYNEMEPETLKIQSREPIKIKNENNSLVFSWSKMVNSNAYSDVIINVKNCKYIYCHEIVLWTRCQNIQKELIANDNNSQNLQSKKLQWLDINFSSAIAFLGYIYCGEIDLEPLKNRENLFYEIFQLAERYKVNELLKDLKGKLMEKMIDKSEIEIMIEDSETNLSTEFEIHRCDEESNPPQNLECSINQNRTNARILKKENELTIDNTEKDHITKIDNGQCNEEINLINNFKESLDRHELNVQISEEKDKLFSDDKEERLKAEMHIEKRNVKINSLKSLKLAGTLVESIGQKMEEETLSNLSHKSPNDSCQLHYSRIITSPDMFEDIEMSYSALVNTERKSNVDETHENCNVEALDILVKLVNEDLLSEISEKDKNDEQFDVELIETPKRYLRLSSTCPDNSTISKMMSEINKNNYTSSFSLTEKKPKSNISLFIERIQRNNAKEILDSDSESEITLSEVNKIRKNPFRIRKSDEDSLFTGKYSQNTTKKGKSLSDSFGDVNKKKSALSLFEDKIRACMAKNSEKFIASQDKHSDLIDVELINNEAQEKNEEQSEVSSDDETDVENASMYTKYKRTHRENSIGNYRSILKNFMQKNMGEDNTKNSSEKFNAENKERIQVISDDSENEDKNIKKNTASKHEISEINKIRLAELSAFDIYETMSPTPLNSSLDNSSKTRSSSSFKSSIDFNASDKASEDENSDGLSIDKSTHSNETSEDINNSSNNKKFDRVSSFECANDDGLEFVSWNEEMLEINNWQPLTQVNFKHKTPDKNSHSNESKQNSESQLSLNELEPIDLTQSDDEDHRNVQIENLQTYQLRDTVTENITRILKDCGVLDSITMETTPRSEKIINNSTPIILSSDSETEYVAGNINIPKNLNQNVENDNLNESPIESNLENNFMGYVIEGGAETAHFTPYSNDFERPNTSRLCINDRNVAMRSNKSIEPSYNSIRSIHTISSNCEEESSRIPENILSPKRSRWSSVSPQKTKSSMKSLKTKSRSDGNLKSKEKRSMNIKLVTPTKQLLSYLNLPSDNCRISFDIASRENYSAMSSPELNKRLAEYGLRNQKRHRAVKLLNYVYDQLHPLVPDYLLTSYHKNDLLAIIDRDVELHNDKLDNKQSDSNDDEGSDSSSISNSSAIVDEMMNLSDEYEEYNEKDVILIRESFQKLINTDRILHNKILKYEPIPLETIYEKLKEKGIKSGPQILADYLDDECISFYVENSKKRQKQKQPTTKKK